MRKKLETFVREPLDQEAAEQLLARMYYVLINLDVPEEYQRLQKVTNQKQRVMVNYFSVAPFLFGAICTGLAGAGLITPETRMVLEKPIGHNLASSREINDLVAKFFNESQVYRIDHYLGKETVMNLLALRLRDANHNAASASLFGTLAGFTSFSIHAGGPPFTMYLLPKGLSPLLFAGTAGMFFAVVNAVKVLPYALLGQFGATNLLASLILVPLAPLGVRIGHFLVRHSNPTVYYRVISFFLMVTGAKLLLDGYSGLQG